MKSPDPKRARPRWPYAVVAMVVVALWLWIGGSGGSADQERGGSAGSARAGAGSERPTRRGGGDWSSARHALRGHVVFPDGSPVAGADVVIQSGPALAPGAARIRTGADGAFRFDDLRGGTYLLGATHGDGVAPTTAAEVSADASEVTLVLYPGASVEVVVRSSAGRAPLAGATVKITDGDRAFGEQWSFRVEQTGADGIARFRGLIANADHLVVASAAGHVETTLAVHANAFADQAWSVEVVLPIAAQVSGRVVDPAGRGVPEATVGWELGGGPRPAGAPDVFDPFPFHGHAGTVTSDAEGRFTIAVEAGGGCVLAAHPEYELAQVCGLSARTGSELSGIELLLRDGARLSGQVVWSDGAPAAGITVIATKRSFLHLPMFSKSYRFETDTGSNGEFEFRGVKRTQLDLAAFSESASSPLVPVDLTGRSELRDVTITLEYEGVIRGRVTEEGGGPVAFAPVEYWIDPTMEPPVAEGKPQKTRRAERMSEHPDLALPRSIGATRADRDGNFEVRGVPEGIYAIKASRPHAVSLPAPYASATEVGIGIGDTVEIVLPGLGGLRGRVVYDSGKPVTTFGIGLAHYTPKFVRDQFTVSRRVVSSDGTFAIDGIPAGSYRVRLEGGDFVEVFVPDAAKVANGTSTDIGTVRVVKGERRTGVVLSKELEPVDSAKVTVAVDDRTELWVSIETAEDGSFALPPTPRDQTIRIRADKIAATSGWVELPPTTKTVRLVMSQDGVGAVTGVILEPGAPLQDRVIVLTLVGQGTPGGELQSFKTALTQAGGAFRMEGIPGGEYLIWVRRASKLRQVDGDVWWTPEKPVIIEPLMETQLMLQIPPQEDPDGSEAPPGGGGSGAGSNGDPQ